MTANPRPGTIGSPVKRREDPALITGDVRYTDDLSVPDQVYMAVLRSRYAHARVSAIDAAAALGSDDVLGVYTAADIKESDVPGTVPPPAALAAPDGPKSPISIVRPLPEPNRGLLADRVVRYVGEPLAVVLASDRYTANNAIDRIDVDYDRQPAVVDPVNALEHDTVSVHAARENNVAFEWTAGVKEAAASALKEAPCTVTVEFDVQRLVSSPIEPRAILARYHPESGKLTVHRPGQGPHTQRDYLSHALGLPPDKIRVKTPAVGGSFGMKGQPHPAEFLAGWCSMELGRPVKWQATRSEEFRSSAPGRGHSTRGELAVADDGRFLGLSVESTADVGAYVFGSTPLIHTKSFASALSAQYAIPAIHCHVTGVFTTTTPISAYRGTGRPCAIRVVERLVDRAAATLGIDPAEIRRRNLIPPGDFPYETPLGYTYDSGNYEPALDRVLELLGYAERRGEQISLRDDGRYLGIGLACSIDQISSPIDSARVEVHPSGDVSAYCGTLDSGQGHETTFAQLLAEELGIPADRIDVYEGDSADLERGGGTGGSRSAVNAGTVLVECGEHIVDKARRIAADELEAAQTDLEFNDGQFSVTGAPARAISIEDVARKANRPGLPGDMERGLEATVTGAAPTTYSFATHGAVVEVQPDTGEVEILRYVAVEDCGPQINPTVVRGQIHGATTQGIGQALFEGVVYDESGTPLTGSFQDYALPKAVHIPDFAVDTTVTPSPDTVRGIKGIGESGTNVAPAAVANAVFDALSPLGVSEVDLPLTAESVWRAI